jgi:lysophospholipase L1-like esterase
LLTLTACLSEFLFNPTHTIRSEFRMNALVLTLLAIAQPAAQGAAWEPAARAKEHPWMSIATWKKLHEGHLARTKKGGVDVVFLGDSITQGWGGAGAPVWKKRFEPLNAANYGIGGDTTREVLYRLNDGILDGIKPKAVVLLIGTNNFGLFGDSAADTAKGVEAVVASVRKKAPGAKVLLLGIFPRDKAAGTAFRKKITEANEAIAKLADGKSVIYLDLGKKFLADDGTLPVEVMPDALHLSEKGYGIWADAIEEPLRTLLK